MILLLELVAMADKTLTVAQPVTQVPAVSQVPEDILVASVVLAHPHRPTPVHITQT